MLYIFTIQSNADCRLSLRRLQGLTNLDIVHLMLKEVSQKYMETLSSYHLYMFLYGLFQLLHLTVKSEGPSFISDFVERVVPFITRLEELQSGSGRQCLSEYMTTIAKVQVVQYCVAFYCLSATLLNLYLCVFHCVCFTCLRMIWNLALQYFYNLLERFDILNNFYYRPDLGF